MQVSHKTIHQSVFIQGWCSGAPLEHSNRPYVSRCRARRTDNGGNVLDLPLPLGAPSGQWLIANVSSSQS